MKKIITTLLLCSLCALTFAAPKKGKSNSIKLDVKTKFAIEGVELGSIDWCKNDASLTPKGEIVWAKEKDGDEYLHYGWELRGTDLSAYAGLKIQVAPLESQEDLSIELENPACSSGCTFRFGTDGVCYVFFDGRGRGYGDMKNPDLKEGYEIRFLVKASKLPKTVIKSIELLSKEDYPDLSYLDLLGVQFGSTTWQTRIIGNEITWLKGYQDGNAGWNLEGIDLSEYDRIRIELESNDRTGLEISMNEKDGKNYHAFNQQIEPGVYEADLSGEGASWKNDDATDLNKANGLSIFLHYWNQKPSTKECHTVVKSVQLLKGKRVANENLMLLGSNIGSSSWKANVFDGGIIEWTYDGNKSAQAGWNLTGIDLSTYDKIRIEIESSDTPVDLRMCQYDKNDRNKRADIYFQPVKPNVLEAYLDGTGYTGHWEEGGYSWENTKRIDEIQIHVDPISKKGLKTKVKSVILLKAGAEVPQPENLVLNGAKLGSIRDKAYVDDDFAINWTKGNYAQCGWRLEKLDGDILEVKVTSTDVPLKLRIRENANSNESSWLDDGTHIFRINLKDKKQESRGNWKASEWNKMSKEFDFSQGCEIVLEPVNGVFKEGKKTLVEYIKVE